MEDEFFKKIFRLNVLIIIADLLLIFIRKNYLPEQVPLFYSRPWGKEQLTNKYYLSLVPGISLVVLAINSLVFRFLLKKEERFLAFVSLSFSFLFSVLGIITLFKIIFLIT